MLSEITVSVIIPIFNADKYLKKGLQSVLNQTLQKMEIICVDDGSSDNSLKILNELKNQYQDKLCILQQEHKGAFLARQYGIEYAHGKYIGFMDCDDEIQLDMYEKLWKQTEDMSPEMVVCGFQRVDRISNKILSREMVSYGNVVLDMKSSHAECMAINTSLWNKIIKADVAKRHVHLENPPRMLEDMMLLASIYPLIDKVAFIDDVLYTYYVDDTSVMKNITCEEIAELQSGMIDTRTHALKMDSSSDIEYLMDGMAFIHYGISLILGIAHGRWKATSYWKREMGKWLDEFFPLWKNNPYLNWKYVKNHSNLRKPMVVLWLYKFHLFTAFMAVYVLVTEKIKINVKW